ncbi:TLC domain-containing protein 3A-like isoform X1 [Cyprinodon tularosa]|uniref:TLC domain-containing protein 3A-like isoform X1 n=1 Tax=Cyprinodon tularosa TaxID=77115 RepID=UPI0018E1FED2|nr:TLC domain-containing protein 3A-like isoform X1 [Cyprinodon tularosa]
MAALFCGAALFPGLFFSFRRILRNTWTDWSDADVTAVSERLLSAVHASLATAAGVTVVSSCRDVMTDSHWLVNSFVLFGAPYMLFDIYAMYLNHRHTQEGSQTPSRRSLHAFRAFLLRDWMLVLHHLVLVFIFLPITLFFRRGLGDFFIGCLFLTELSTPFISVGKILIQLHLDDTKLYRINGLVALLTFFTCRILLFPFMYWMYGRHASVPLHRVAFHLPLHCNLGNLLLLAPQVYWFGLLLRKAQRLYRRTRKSD